MIIYSKIGVTNVIRIENRQSFDEFIDYCIKIMDLNYFSNDLHFLMNKWVDCGYWIVEGKPRLIWGINEEPFNLFNCGMEYFIHIKTLVGLWLYKGFYDSI